MEKKDIYNEIGTNYRYFLDWRHKLLAGYLVSIAGLAIGFSWAMTNSEIKHYSWIILLLGIIISLVFWGLDYRNRDLFHICLRAGMALEKNDNITDGQEIYTTLETSKKRISHGLVLDIMFSIATFGFLVGTIIAAFCMK